MPAIIYFFPLPKRPSDEESFDVQDLASQAAAALEAYQRAPWRKLCEETRIAKLCHALKLLKRIEGIETGQIAMPSRGD